ncbi:hypothetical protein NKR19_g8988 [Coniochaeta hoffmannii]|uniref:Life-span regulatory factor domain-containing protein n=1 Tax=Coniochaeta hoffmannii TaxID=91930 RepID=A0AA38VHV9_9PEZI|nr:hypothetical protein NKR19_g8988 [Coniochaeta hoffmannii]
MSLDWTHQFCLSCDKQTDGTAYCSESCRLADYEKTSAPSPSLSSPGLADSSSSYPWTFSKPTTTSRPLYLAPAYDFSNAQPYSSLQRSQSTGGTLAPKALSPSTSHSSLCSMKSTSSTDSQLSEKATRELRAYARSFESVRLQRRRSY